MSTRPRGARLGIGLPVRNGENYLSEALACLLGQTFTDFRLIIADNASTDRTEAICRDAADRDKRVVYIRHPHNIGAAGNFNFLFHASPCELFKWAAHDDLMAPTYLERCVGVLDAEPGVVLSHAASQWIDGRGSVLGPASCPHGIGSGRVSERFVAALSAKYPAMIWGVMRRDAAAATGLIGGFVNADRYFLAELLLRGRASVLPDTLFSVRRHAESFTDEFYRMRYRERLAWFNPRAGMRGLAPMTATGGRLVRRFISTPMPVRDRAACAAYLVQRAAGFAGRRARTFLSGQETFKRGPAPAPAGVLAGGVGETAR